MATMVVNTLGSLRCAATASGLRCPGNSAQSAEWSPSPGVNINAAPGLGRSLVPPSGVSLLFISGLGEAASLVAIAFGWRPDLVIFLSAGSIATVFVQLGISERREWSLPTPAEVQVLRGRMN
jgi:hypothetical protein